MLCIQVSAAAGEDIQTACRDMVALAKRLDCMVEMSFNGVLVLAFSTSDPLGLVKHYFHAHSSKAPSA